MFGAMMIRKRLVRQGAVVGSGSSDNSNSNSMSSPPPPAPVRRRRRSSQDAKMLRQMSSESLDQLLKPSSSAMPHSRSAEGGGGRRHSVACLDAHKPSIKSALNSAVRRMSDACSMLSSAPSSTYNLSAPPKRENEVILPSVLRTYRPPPPKPQGGGPSQRSSSSFQSNRRFSTDCPPPTYSEATSGWKHSTPKQKLLIRQNDVVMTSPKASLVAVEDDDVAIRQQN